MFFRRRRRWLVGEPLTRKDARKVSVLLVLLEFALCRGKLFGSLFCLGLVDGFLSFSVQCRKTRLAGDFWCQWATIQNCGDDIV